MNGQVQIQKEKFNFIKEATHDVDFEDFVMDVSRILAVIPNHKLNHAKLEDLIKQGKVEKREIRIDRSVQKIQISLAELSGELLGKYNYGFNHEYLAKAIYHLSKVFCYAYNAVVYYAKEINPIIVEIESHDSNTPVIILAPRHPDDF